VFEVPAGSCVLWGVRTSALSDESRPAESAPGGRVGGLVEPRGLLLHAGTRVLAFRFESVAEKGEWEAAIAVAAALRPAPRSPASAASPASAGSGELGSDAGGGGGRVDLALVPGGRAQGSESAGAVVAEAVGAEAAEYGSRLQLLERAPGLVLQRWELAFSLMVGGAERVEQMHQRTR
jgi:hypothetical protein